MSDQHSALPGQYLTFLICGDAYGVAVLRVKEILEYENVTRVPGTPASIRGVMNLRGSVVPVVDFAAKMGLPVSPITKRTCIVVHEVQTGGEQLVLGVVADSVRQVVELRAEDIEPPPSFGTRLAVDYLTGIGKAGGKFVLLLDVDRLLSPAELFAASAATAEAPLPAPPEGAASAAAPAPIPLPPPGQAPLPVGR
jgi:purine-binding chemotaxis protein CheW